MCFKLTLGLELNNYLNQKKTAAHNPELSTLAIWQIAQKKQKNWELL